MLLSLMMVLAMPSPGCTVDAIEHGRRIVQRLDVGGTAREVILDVPDAVHAKQPAPLLLDFHGFSHSGAGVWEVSGFKPLAARQGFITAYPEGLPVTLTLRGEARTGAGWQMDAIDGNRDVAFVRALLDDLERRWCIDRSRIYATGFSNGAYFSQLLACALADRIAAVAPVSGGRLQPACLPTRPVPILIQHGSEDPLIPAASARAARDEWVRLNGCAAPATAPADSGPACQRWDQCRAGAVVEYCEEPYAHRWPPQATDRAWSFLSRYRLP